MKFTKAHQFPVHLAAQELVLAQAFPEEIYMDIYLVKQKMVLYWFLQKITAYIDMKTINGHHQVLVDMVHLGMISFYCRVTEL